MRVVVYSQPSCAPCKTLYYFLYKNNIAYKVKDTTDEANMKEMLEATGLMMHPTLMVETKDGKGLPITHYVSGLNISKAKEVLGLR